MASDPPRDDTFEIGLVLAGGQSAGCYLAGVLDFLFEALDSWDQARRAEPDKFPNHKVRIKIIVGASAGGLNAALAAIGGRYRFVPASHARIEDSERNLGSPFYRAWVRDIDITDLLSTDDLAAGGKTLSLLNARYLDEMVARYLDFAGDGIAADRDWLDDPMPVKVMVSNIDGVLYQVRFTTDRDDTGNANSYWMSQHGDHLAFLRPLSRDPKPPTPPDHDVLSVENSSSAESWRRLGQSALATAAFPVALTERIIERPTTDYDYRHAYPFAPGGLVYAPPFPGEKPREARFLTIDGGLIDNEPFELAHTALAGSEGHNPREGDRAKRAVILVVPFVTPPKGETGQSNTPLPKLLAKIATALIGQSRFKPIDLSLAATGDTYSRFMVAPVRTDASGAKIRGNAALASRPLTMFLGYFSRHYRHHDFMLGRLNCYQFLHDWFVLPGPPPPGSAGAEAAPANTLFAHWPAPALADPAYRSQSSLRPGHRQIIPLVGTAAREPDRYAWPAGQFAGYSAIERNIKERVNALYPLIRDRVLGEVIGNGLGRWFGKLAVSVYWRLSGRSTLLSVIKRMVDGARDEIDADRH